MHISRYFGHHKRSTTRYIQAVVLSLYIAVKVFCACMNPFLETIPYI